MLESYCLYFGSSVVHKTDSNLKATIFLLLELNYRCKPDLKMRSYSAHETAVSRFACEELHCFTVLRGCLASLGIIFFLSTIKGIEAGLAEKCKSLIILHFISYI